MSKEIMRLSEEQLDEVCGGVTQNLLAAYDVMAGKYGTGEERRGKLESAGYNGDTVMTLVSSLENGYGPVACDVIKGKYGSGAAQRANLIHAGYDPDQVTLLVSNMMWR